jgi:phosphomannomutase / phosphoglucomutase
MKLEIHPHVFREYDIRGIAGEQISPEFAECLGKAYTLYVKGRKPTAGRKNFTISVGWDCRLSSDSYANAVVSGLSQGGIDVVRLGVWVYVRHP